LQQNTVAASSAVAFLTTRFSDVLGIDTVCAQHRQLQNSIWKMCTLAATCKKGWSVGFVVH
jgi:hypothetical protein